MDIKIITSSDPEWIKTVEYAENCSWRGSKFLVDQMRKGRFQNWERVLVAAEDGNIAGYCSVCAKDCIPDVPYTPFIGSLFVGEAYRGHRLSLRLIETAMEYLGAVGFDAVYLFSDHVGLYEKYGFSVIAKFNAPWGEEQKLFQRKLDPK